jgi:hypothetical protein
VADDRPSPETKTVAAPIGLISPLAGIAVGAAGRFPRHPDRNRIAHLRVAGSTQTFEPSPVATGRAGLVRTAACRSLVMAGAAVCTLRTDRKSE